MGICFSTRIADDFDYFECCGITLHSKLCRLVYYFCLCENYQALAYLRPKCATKTYNMSLLLLAKLFKSKQV